MKILIVGFFLFVLIACKREIESPYIVAQKHCDCIDSLFVNSKDSLVDINKCNYVYGSSRFMNIYLKTNNLAYSKLTEDSASQFADRLWDIQDSICYNKIDRSQKKKITIGALLK